MTNDRIQAWLSTWLTTAAAGRPYSMLAKLDEADQIIRFLTGTGGALHVADQFACDLIVSECIANFSEQCMWWELELAEGDLPASPSDVERRIEVDRAVTYLRARGLLLEHPERKHLVRPQLAPI